MPRIVKVSGIEVDFDRVKGVYETLIECFKALAERSPPPKFNGCGVNVADDQELINLVVAIALVFRREVYWKPIGLARIESLVPRQPQVNFWSGIRRAVRDAGKHPQSVYRKGEFDVQRTPGHAPEDWGFGIPDAFSGRFSILVVDYEPGIEKLARQFFPPNIFVLTAKFP
jgi:hypothetical protein